MGPTCGVKFLEDSLSGEKITFPRDGFTESVQNGQRVSVRSPVRRCSGGERGKVWAKVDKFGFTPGCAVRPGLLGVRRADRDVEGGVRVAEDRGEEVGGPEVSARDETGNFSLGSAVVGLSRSVHKCSDRVVAAGGLAQDTTGGVGGACVQGSRPTGGAGHPFTRSGAAQAQAYQIDVLRRWEGPERAENGD